MITIPDGVTPEDIMRGVDILPGQDWLSRSLVIEYANQMSDGSFPWEAYNREEPIAIEIGINGKVLTQGHHRFVAARLAGVALPIPLIEHSDLIEAGLAVIYAVSWAEVIWE